MRSGRGGTYATYFRNPATGLLLRYEGNDSRGTAPVVVDLLERGPVEVPLPPVSAMGAGARD